MLVTTTVREITTTQDTITRNTTNLGMIIPVTTTKTFLLGIVLVVLVLFSACSSEPTVTVSTPTVGSKTEPTPTPIIIYITVTVVVTSNSNDFSSTNQYRCANRSSSRSNGDDNTGHANTNPPTHSYTN